MTISDAITRIDALKFNTYTELEKTAWLSTIDGMIKREIIDTHEGGDSVVFNGYDENTPIDTELLVPAPYDDLYIKWLEAQIDYTNGEYGKYNNSKMAFNTAYTAYESWYNRQHMPLGKKFKCF
ncbi:MAG: hypothetical protein IKK29_03620 [Christensenellaceae bacterium]|nr:hypothetical protein [Christensenellaceae bacterium]